MLKTITFQIGTDVIGQPIYYTHFVSSSKDRNGKESIVVNSLQHR